LRPRAVAPLHGEVTASDVKLDGIIVACFAGDQTFVGHPDLLVVEVSSTAVLGDDIIGSRTDSKMVVAGLEENRGAGAPR